MPRYEFAFILKALENPSMLSAIKSVATLVMENKGVIRKIENLGEKALPYKMRAHSKIFDTGRYVLFDTEIPPTELPTLRWKLGLEENVIRCTILSKHTPSSTVTAKGLTSQTGIDRNQRQQL